MADETEEPKRLTVADLHSAFNGRAYASADELAAAVGRKPGKKWQRALKKALARAGIEPIRAYIDGKRHRVYCAEHFAANASGTVNGTPALRQRLEGKAAENRNALGIHDVMEKLLAIHRELGADKELSSRKRFDAIRRSLEYYEQLYAPRD